jgi:hypothetical protein
MKLYLEGVKDLITLILLLKGAIVSQLPKPNVRLY